jgi:hypothetical protein
MNWKTIFSLSLFGFLMGIASIFGYTKGIEWILWIVIGVISAFVINKSGGKLFLNSLLTGICMAIVNSIIQAVFIDMYIQNNPEATQQTQDGALEFTVGLVLLMGIPIGIVYGLFIALLVWIFSKFVRKPQTA